MTRLRERLDELYAIGGGPGANRVGYSPEEDAAHELAAGWLREAGFEVDVDEHGNLLGRLPGDEPELPEVWTGSHLDTVPQGGRYDGALGVVAGIEALGFPTHDPHGDPIPNANLEWPRGGAAGADIRG